MSHWQPKSNEQGEALRVFRYVLGAHVAIGVFLFFSLVQAPLHIGKSLPSDVRVVCLPSYMIPPKQHKSLRKKSSPVAKAETKEVLSTKNLVKKDLPQRGFSKRRLFSKRAEALDPVPKKKEIVPPAPVAKEIEPVVEQVAVEATEEQEVLYVNKETYASLQLAHDLQQAVAEHWLPPAGAHAQAACEVKVVLSATGSVKEVQVIKKSGIPVYDMAARQALMQTEYPRAVWNRIIIVHFNEDFSCAA